MPWTTPQTPPPEPATWAIDLPDGYEWRTPVWGALIELGHSANWTDTGIGADEVAEAMRLIYGTIRKVHILRIGDVVWSARDEIDPTRLKCDGSLYDASLYPELFSILGYTYGGTGSHFAVPSLGGRVPIGAGTGPDATTYALGDEGGSRRVSLSTSQLPSHSHTIPGEITTFLAQLGAGELVKTPNPIPSDTGDTGGGQSHENMPPFVALNAYIVAVNP